MTPHNSAMDNELKWASSYELEWASSYVEWRWSRAVGVNVESLKADAAPRKAMVVERVRKLGPPPQFRLIDCELSLQRKKVVLVGFHHQRPVAYTAVSHTWGQNVYGVFDCMCASECVNDVPRRGNPAAPCAGAVAHGESFGQVVKDILGMCQLLRTQGGCKFLWHDGVCIAQFDRAELEQTIKHMGWIYASAEDTVIFLDYVGRPRGLLYLDDCFCNAETRWNTRVWTVQEAVLSNRRRYCIRRVPATADVSQLPWLGFVEKIALSYRNDSSIAVIEEDEFWNQILSLLSELKYFFLWFVSMSQTVVDPDAAEVEDKIRRAASVVATRAFALFHHTNDWALLLTEQFFVFPSLQQVLQDCAQRRQSKHIGDRINSVLGLAGITDLVAEKDDNFEFYTVEFFQRLGQGGLRYALFCVNTYHASEYTDEGSVNTWLPSLARSFVSLFDSDFASAYGMQVSTGSLDEQNDDQNPTDYMHENVRYKVLKDGMLELRGTLHCVPVEFIVGAAGSDSSVTVSEDCRSLAISFDPLPDISSLGGPNVEHKSDVANCINMPGPTDQRLDENYMHKDIPSWQEAGSSRVVSASAAEHKSDGPNCMNNQGLISAEHSSDCSNSISIPGLSGEQLEVGANFLQMKNPMSQEAGPSSLLPRSSGERRLPDKSIVTLPVKRNLRTPVIDRQGRSLQQAGDKFSAHLVFGQFYPPHLVGDFSDRICLIVTTTADSDLGAPVSKVGTYIMSRGLHRDFFDTSTREVILTYPILNHLFIQ